MGLNNGWIRPSSTYIRPGEIEVKGDAEHLQRNFHYVTTCATWTKIGNRHWRVKMPACNECDTRFIVEAINRNQQ